MATRRGGLHTLTYRIDPEQLGDVTIYPLTSEFTEAWRAFETKLSLKQGDRRDDYTPPYSHLATALTAVTGQPVRLFTGRHLSTQEARQGLTALVVTTTPIPRAVLATAIRAFERLSLKDHHADTLAPRLATVTPAIEPLARHVHTEQGTVIAPPPWLYDVAGWHLATLLAHEPLLVDGHLPIVLRPDTAGNLLAWNDPLTRMWSTGMYHATVYVETAVVTLPGATALYLRLDGHIARHPRTWWDVKNVWVDPCDDGRQPVLRLPVDTPWPARGRHHPGYKGFAAAIAQECQLNPIPYLPDQPPGEPGPVRLIGKPSKHPIGKGPGARFMHQLQQHAARQLHQPSLTYQTTKVRVPPATTGPVPAQAIDAAITAAVDERSRIDHLRITCLYATQPVRRRMTDALRPYALHAPDVLHGVPDDTPTNLTDRMSVVFHHDPELLAHGDHTRDLDTLSCLNPPAAGAVIALVETAWERGEPIEHDAKPILRAELAKRGIVAQFINSKTSSAPRRSRRSEAATTKDHPADAAVRDLMRQAGITDDRLAIATSNRKLAHPLNRPASLVGLHIRHHTPRRVQGKKKEPNRLVIRVVAMHASPTPDPPWAVQMFDDNEGWISYREANARYHATDIGKTWLDRTNDKAQFVREYVDQALASLPKATPLVLFVDAEACRRYWKGLTNARFGHDPVPGTTSNHPDLAVVRCASGNNAPRPTSRTNHPDPYKPSLTRAYLYEHHDHEITSWLLAQPSRVHRSGEFGARAGTDFTRWTLPDNRDTWMARDWHALTAIEIAVPRTGTWQPNDLAALTARLCEQAASWDDRTLSPAPLHLAEASDQDHPRHTPDDDQPA